MTASRIVCFALAGVVGSFVSAHAALLGVAPGFPTLLYDNSGVMTYDSATDLLIVDAFPLAIRFTPFGVPRLVQPTGDPAMERVFIQIHVDESGDLIGGIAGDDLVVIGQVDQDGDTIPDFSGVLLTGEVAGFGFREKAGPNALFDFRFVVTGGSMASEFGGTIGVLLTSESSSFPGTFNQSFSGFAKGNIGPITFRCGDGFVDGGEQCDDGAGNSDTQPNVCRTDCTLAGCGDGVVDTGEQCDDGNADNNDDCSNNCTAGCGNGIVNTGEQCDDGADNSDTVPDACRTDCTPAACGDGVVDTGEQCDDGADNSDTVPDACRTDCTLAACGDGVADEGEQCDDGNNIDDDLCTNACTPSGNPCEDDDPCTEDLCVCDDDHADGAASGDGDDVIQVCVCPTPCDDNDGGGAKGSGDDNGDGQSCKCVHRPICTGDCCPDCDDGDPCTVDTCVSRSGDHDDDDDDDDFGTAKGGDDDDDDDGDDGDDGDDDDDDDDGDDDDDDGQLCKCKHTNTCFCGDNVVNRQKETCDGPDFRPGSPPGLTCRSDCTFCGDGIKQASNGEECDGNDTTSGGGKRDKHGGVDCSRGCDSNCECIGCGDARACTRNSHCNDRNRCTRDSCVDRCCVNTLIIPPPWNCGD